MLKLKTLKLKNIGRFTEQQTIEFDNLGNLVQVDAQNNNTGGSSGSGKSTIFNALDWLLGLSSLSTSTLQSRLTKDHMSVEGVFDWDGKEITIHRAKKLSIAVNYQETIGSSKLTEELLDTIIGMPRDLFRPLLHKRQGEQGFFLQMTPAQMNSFLVDCLGLSSIRDKINLVDEKIKSINTDKTTHERSLDTLQGSLSATKSALESLGLEPKTGLTEGVLERIKGNLDRLRNLLSIRKTHHNQEVEFLNQKRPIITFNPFDRSDLDSITNEININQKAMDEVFNVAKSRNNTTKQEIDSLKTELKNKLSEIDLKTNIKISELKRQFTELKRIEEAGINSQLRIEKINSDLLSLKDGICQTCQQEWMTDESEKEEFRLTEELELHKVRVKAGNEAVDGIRNLKTEILKVQYNDHKSTLSTIYSTKIGILEEQLRPKEDGPELEALRELNYALMRLTERKLLEKDKEEQHGRIQVVENDRVMNEFLSEQKNLRDLHQKETAAITRNIERVNDLYIRHRSALESYNTSLERYKTSLSALESNQTNFNSKISDLNLKLTQIKEEIEIAEEVKRCLKSYISCSFDDALYSISNTATKILRAIPTMSNATIRLEGTKETNAGAIKEQVNACLDNDGDISIPIKSLSGGERSAVDLAVDMAVCEMIQEKANKGIDLIILDEQFGGFDSVGIENALEMLRTVNKRVLVVEHDSVAKEFVNDKITVVREGETSFIR